MTLIERQAMELLGEVERCGYLAVSHDGRTHLWSRRSDYDLGAVSAKLLAWLLKREYINLGYHAAITDAGRAALAYHEAKQGAEA